MTTGSQRFLKKRKDSTSFGKSTDGPQDFVLPAIRRKAVAEYRKAISLNNSHEDALYYLGNMYFDLGELEAAEQIWRRLAEVNPNSARAHSQLGTIYLMIENGNMFNLDAAEAEFQRAFAINKEVTAPVLRLGQIALIRGNFSESQRLFNAVIGSNTRSVEAHFLTGYIDWKRGNLQKALNFSN